MRTILTRIGLAAVLLGLTATAYAQGLLAPRVIQTEQANIGAAATPAWVFSFENALAKLPEAEALLADAEVSAGKEQFSYTERRIVSAGIGYQLEEQEFQDVERRIALALLNKETGALERVTVTTRGNLLIAPDGYQLEMVELVSGLQWNGPGTRYRVNAPRNSLVLMVKYPYRKTASTIKPVAYTTFTDELDLDGVMENGARYSLSIVQDARDGLTAKRVRSRAVPGKLVTEVIPADFVKHLPFMEQTDTNEMFLIFDEAVERVLGTFGYNREKAYTLTCNSVGACGLVQFTDINFKTGKPPGTYTAMVRRFPAAKLIADFRKGAADHVNSMQAAILLYDDNLLYFINTLGRDIVNHPRLKELLAAGYNGKPARAVAVFRKAQKEGQDDQDSWIDGLRQETQGFIAKQRKLEQNNVPERYLD